MVARLIVCRAQNVNIMHSTNLAKACRALTSIKLTLMYYIKPVRSLPLAEGNPQTSFKAKCNFSAQIPTRCFNASNIWCGKSKCTFSSFSSVTFDAADSVKAASWQSESYTSSMHNDETSSAAASKVDPVRLGSRNHIYDEPDGCDKLNLTFEELETPVQKVPHIPKYVEGSNEKSWNSWDFPWTKDMEVYNKKVFGNDTFRPNQREVINATMSGHDVFVLMPNGAGKSLTYQLPACICRGITLVISPLLSLIQDQTTHLLELNINTACLCVGVERTQQEEIVRELSSLEDCKYKLLYVTPERIAGSEDLLLQLKELYARQLLNRIVIIEAYYVSQWKHFKHEYQHLGNLKRMFPHTPLLAVTATASPSVIEDVMQSLGVVDFIIFRQSLNRPNLQYSVLPKTKNWLDDIDNFIEQNHPYEHGIIYCLNRWRCKVLAEELKMRGHKATFYFAGMRHTERESVHRRWSGDKTLIICATEGSAIGTNKPDIRFVIHSCLPKSIDSYYQACGHAGRDGRSSSCVLLYTYGEYITMKRLISERHVSLEENYKKEVETKNKNLLQMVSYCENNVDCRGFQLLAHFGEKFDPINCKKACDNCSNVRIVVEKDVTEIAKQLIELVKSVKQQFSAAHILSVYRGSLNQFVKEEGHESLSLHGAGKHLAKGEALRVLRHLVTENYLVEDVKSSGPPVLKVNETNTYHLCSSGQTIKLRFPFVKQAKGSPTSKKRTPLVNENKACNLCTIGRTIKSRDAVLQSMSKKVPRSKEELLKDQKDCLSAKK